MSHKITITLSESGINNAIKQLDDYKKWIEQKTAQLIERLAIIGAQEASIRFASAQYDGVNDVEITVEPIANGWKIITNKNSQAAWFIEFGAGVYHNGSEPYPNPPGRSSGVSNIGEYGHGMGKRQGWTYEGDNPGSNGKVLENGRIFTRGNPAAMPLYYASQEMINKVTQIAREVFAS